jgi:hypothetical protein
MPTYNVFASQVRDGRVSESAELTFDPRLTGSSHACSRLARVEAQMS